MIKIQEGEENQVLCCQKRTFPRKEGTMSEYLPKNRRCGATQQIPSAPTRGWEADPERGRFQGWEHGLKAPSQLLLVLQMCQAQAPTPEG